MIRRTPLLDALELKWERDYPVKGARYRRMIEAMYAAAQVAWRHSNRDPADGLEEKIRLVQRLHGVNVR